MAGTVSPAVRALLERVIDYAGTFPPAMLTRDIAIENYESYQQSRHSWILRWLVIGAGELAHVPRRLDGAISVLSEVDEPRAAALESKRILVSERPTYCEVPLEELDRLKQAGGYAKLRTGGVKPDAVPATTAVKDFILSCATLRLPFKATAGLHHPIRASYPLTYESDAPRAMMHGFLNVLLAAAFAWNGRREIEPILAETDSTAFRFDERVHWRDWSLDAEQVREARSLFAHAFGSCSFEEPVRELEALGYL